MIVQMSALLMIDQGFCYLFQVAFGCGRMLRLTYDALHPRLD